jgi:membrane protein DedA with SNARE-associated domain
MSRWIIHLVDSLSYWGVAFLMAIENVVLPLPSEVIMPLGGFEASRGRMTVWGVVIAGSVGSALGALPLYWIARVLGETRITSWISRHGRWLLLRPNDLRKAQSRFKRYGGRAVFFSQLLPGIRGLVSLPAGFADMNVFLFLLANLAGTLIWCGVLAPLGYLLGRNYGKVHAYVGRVSWFTVAGLAGWGVAWLVRRRTRRTRDGRRA